jgi:two-component system CheB/CheR fusion protein
MTETSGVGSTTRSARGTADPLIGAIQELSLARSLAQVQEIVRHAARALTGADGATFVLRDGDLCFYADEDAIQPLWKGRRFPMASCITGWAMLHRQPAVIEDVFADPRIPIEAYRPTFVKSLAVVPIRTRDPVGAIGNYWASRHRADDEQVRLLQALADSTSIALTNVTLIEELVAAKRAAEEALRLKDQFLTTMSHELRTPLNAILGWSGLLADGTLSALETRDAARAIHEGAQHELRLVEDLLDVSRIISGELSLELEPTDVVVAVAQAIQSTAAAAAAAEAKSVRTRLSSPPDLPHVRANPRRLQQIAWNLLSNAVKFTSRGGTVHVRLERGPADVRLIVADDGIGIDPAFAPHLFERFRQQDGSTTRRAGGMGLGLAMVRHLVELHGGSVRAESPGRNLGSTFTVTLPVAGA